MTTDNRGIDDIMEFVEAVCACPEPGEYAPAVEEAKYEAIVKVLSTTSFYRQHGIRNELVHTIFRQKIKMIRKASTVKGIKAIEKGPIPQFDGNRFVTGQYHIPEEELVLWSLTSLKGPLIAQGFDRYLELFKQVFGFGPEDHLDGAMEEFQRREAAKC